MVTPHLYSFIIHKGLVLSDIIYFMPQDSCVLELSYYCFYAVKPFRESSLIFNSAKTM